MQFAGADYVNGGFRNGPRNFYSGDEAYGGGGFQFQLKSVLDSGMHAGRHIDEVDYGYLQWIVNKIPESDSWWKTAATGLTRRRMNQEQSAKLNVRDLLSELKSCTRKKDLQKGRGIHTDAVEAGMDSNIYVANALVNLYAKCGSCELAKAVFDNVQEPSVVSWNCLIMGYADNGQGLVALNLFSRMKLEGRCAPNSFTYVAALKAACTLLETDGEAGKRECLERVRQMHSEIGCYMDQYVQTMLINLYAKCGSMEDVKSVFDTIHEPDVVSWNHLIQGYAENGHGLVALNLFSRMKEEGKCVPNSFTYVAALKACTLLATDEGEVSKSECLQRGKQIHCQIGCQMDQFLQSMLINLYAKCGSMEDARTVFDSIQEPSVVSWNCLVLGYADNGQGLIALDLFSRMKDKGALSPFTYVAALKACTLLADEGEAGKRECLERGRQIHSEIGRQMDQFMQSTLINLYAKCGSMEDARKVFDSIQEPDVVSWNCLILGYADNGQCLAALDLLSRMKDEGRCAPDSFTYVTALKACTLLAAGEAGKRECLKRGRQIHSEIGRHMDRFVQNTLIKLYSECGSMEDARTLFDSIQYPDVVAWSALIMGYAENGQGLVALHLFSRMQDEGRCAPNSVTYVAALMACCSIGALAMGRKIHSVITEFDSHVVTCLVDFYAKCGSLEEAREVFDLHPGARNVSTWTALLAGYAQFGDTGSVFSLFEAMQDQGFQPNSVTFVCVLSCCSNAGLVTKAWEYLELMPTRYGVTPTVMHYSCMIDLLGRANKLEEAVNLLQKMPCDPNAVTWTALLCACRKWKNADIGRWAFKSLMDLDQTHAPAYVVMAEIYGSRGMWAEQERVLEARLKFGACKLPGKAYVMDERARTVEFMVGEEDYVDVGNGYESYSMSSTVRHDVLKALCETPAL